MKPLSPRERRLIALGLAVAAIVLVQGFVVQPIVEGFVDRASAREELEAEYQRNARILDGAVAWRELASRQAETMPNFALVADDAPSALNILQTRLSDVLSQEGGTIRSVGEREASRADRVGVGADAEMTLPQLFRSLARLEHEDPYVLVDSLAIAAVREGGTDGAIRLSVRLEISAPILVRPPEAGEAPGTAPVRDGG